MLNQNIKNLRKQKGYTQEAFAQELNVVRQTVSKWEKGYSVPDAIMLEKIAELFEVSVSDLLGNTEVNPEDRNDFRQISEQLSLLNSQIARELSRKRRTRKIILIIFGVLIFAAILFSVCIFIPESVEEPIIGTFDYCQLDDNLEKAVHQIILSESGKSDWTGEFLAESHVVYGTEENGKEIKLYLLENISSFGFMNGFFVEVAGHCVPAVYTLKSTESGIEFVNRQYAQDGSLYESSIKEMFPRKIAKEILSGTSQESRSMMLDSVKRQAYKYLNRIKRDTDVVDYADIEHILLEDCGISADISNMICDVYPDYDWQMGNHEKTEDGVRYVYQTDYDERYDRITFTKFEYGKNKIVEFIAVDGTTGKVIKDAPIPEKVKYIKGRLVPKRQGTVEYTTFGFYQ